MRYKVTIVISKDRNIENMQNFISDYSLAYDLQQANSFSVKTN